MTTQPNGPPSPAADSAPPSAGIEGSLQTGLSLYAQGRLTEAAVIYTTILEGNPTQFEALLMLGTISLQSGNFAHAADCLGEAVKINPGAAIAHNNCGNALFALGRLDEALRCYERAQVLLADHPDFSFNCATVLLRLGRLDEAAANCDRTLVLNPANAVAHCLRGNVMLRLRRPEEAAASYAAAIAIKDDYVEAHNNRGIALAECRRWDEALHSYDRALTFNSQQAEAHSNRGNALTELRRLDDALASYDRALALKPDFVEALNNRANVLKEFRRFDEALASCDSALALNPNHIGALINRGNVLQELDRLEDSLVSYDRALTLDADRAEVHYNRGNALVKLKRITEAPASYEKALKQGHRIDFLLSNLVEAKLKICDWRDLQKLIELVKADILASRLTTPFSLLSFIADPQLQKRAAITFSAARYPKSSELGKIPLDPRKRRLRIGYYSTDFRSHPVGFVMQPLLKAHDRSGFEVFAFSFGPDEKDEVRDQIIAAVDHFVEVKGESDRAIAQRSRDLGIDIAIDLNGYTGRPGIFAERCAAVQATYLGYYGTMGATYFDYIIADKAVIPPEQHDAFVEKVIYLPGTFFVNGAVPAVSEQGLTRDAMGLPESAFVFCAFHNYGKILPDVFDVWMKLLIAVDDSVLWLRAANPVVEINLKQEAEARGVAGNRLVFAGKVSRNQHFARQKLADLFLDVLPYNAHSTASEALALGLPVLTCAGQSFVSRVATSMLQAVDLPELVTDSLAAYEARALELARDRSKLTDIKRKLAASRATSSLFDVQRQARHLEEAYRRAHERAWAGLHPESFSVT